ncbi:hypothetical protein LUZ60_003533 [Juncus effusus]|nr:hypothetical protein LUZ60_003533 [Juncus effusus]
MEERGDGEEESDKASSSFSSPLPTTASSSKGAEGEEDKEFRFSSHVISLLLGELSPGQAFDTWVKLVRKKSGKVKPSGFPRRINSHNGSSSLINSDYYVPSLLHKDSSLRIEKRELIEDRTDKTEESELETEERGGGSGEEETREASLWERLGNAWESDIESRGFSWENLQSVHRTEHASGNEGQEDDTNKLSEVMMVNSGGVVFFALFNNADVANGDDADVAESAAVIKFSSMKMASQSERLGYEFAKHLGVNTPQARVIHISSPEWEKIREAGEKALQLSVSQEDKEACLDLLEALKLGRCLFFMNYIHGSPLLESPKPFSSLQNAKFTASNFGRVLLLDLILRNEDRLPSRQLSWRGNPANLLISERNPNFTPKNPKLTNPNFNETRKSQTRSQSMNDCIGLNKQEGEKEREKEINEGRFGNFTIYAIDSGVPQRPPAWMRQKDRERYPKVVELILNNSDFSSNILHEISGGKLGFPFPDSEEEGNSDSVLISSFSEAEVAGIVHEFRSGFRAALRDLQSFSLFLHALFQKLEGLLRAFSSIIGKIESDNEMSDAESGSSPIGRENWRGSGEKEMLRAIKLTTKSNDKSPKVDGEVAKEIEQWNGRIKADVIKFCQENNFNTGFFDGSDSNIALYAYELKIRLEHILERILIITEASNTERPSKITQNLFIGGALAAKSIRTLKHLGITDILCLCSNEIGQSDSQFPEIFEYKNFCISDDDDADISGLFEEALDYIDRVENSGGKVLVHCFEGKSRSSTVVLAYLILRKNYTLSDAWSTLKKSHKRAQPNDGFAKVLLTLDKRVHGKVSMTWQQKRPEMKVCPICGKSVGLSTSSLKLHLQKSHKRLSSGSVDSGMSVEIQKVVDGIRVMGLSRTGSVSPTGLSGQVSAWPGEN